jgi:hypothetical protein
MQTSQNPSIGTRRQNGQQKWVFRKIGTTTVVTVKRSLPRLQCDAVGASFALHDTTGLSARD